MNKKILIWGAGIVVVVVVGVLIFNNRAKFSGTQTPGSSDTTAAPAAGGSGSPTRAAAPPNVVVPNAGATGTPANVAVPKNVVPSRPGSATNSRTFEIKAQSGTFTPDTVIAKQGDTIHIYITAVDQNYDFTQPDYGFNTIKIAKGSRLDIPFDGTAPGKFTFYCSSCGGPSKGPVGYIIVSPK